MCASFSRFDYHMMSNAIHLAQKGQFTTAPNPNVGCVITNQGQIVGTGFHFRAGEPHAEVHAMRMAGDKAKGATAYVTLEPCSHYGRTPPCALGLIHAGVKKVICAMQDPNPQVAGRGIQILRDAGIEVEVGLLEEQALKLNPGFIKRMKTGLPWVQLKMATSIDGQVALSNGQSQWITGSDARRDVQRFRALAGAILSTSQTVIADNASLSVRWDELPESIKAVYQANDVRFPPRVILDRQHRLTPDLTLFHACPDSPIITVGEHQDSDVHMVADPDTHRLSLKQLLALLASEHDINHLWVEAGSTLARSLMTEQLVDELILYMAPKIMGSDGQGVFGPLGLVCMDQVVDLSISDWRQIGADFRITAIPTYKD